MISDIWVPAIRGRAMVVAALVVAAGGVFPASGEPDTVGLTPPEQAAVETAPTSYVLGANDQIAIWVLGLAEITDKPVRVDDQGFIDLPMLGRLRAAGKTVSELKQQVTERSKEFVHTPQVSITVVEVKSRPVSVMGAVNKPGLFQIEGGRTIMDVLSMAGGLRPEAGHPIRLTRRGHCEATRPAGLPAGENGEQTIEINTRDLVQSRNPALNLPVCAYDVITVPRADLVYVVGEVQKAGAFEMTEGGGISVLQALSMAGGLTTVASAKNARILRQSPDRLERHEIALNLNHMLAAKGNDSTLEPGDILFVPNSKVKTGGRKALDAAIQLAIGVTIFRR